MNKKRGFTLAETIIYMAVLAMFMIAIVQGIMGFLKSYRVIKTLKNIENSAIISMDRMQREIRNATSITAISTSTNPGSFTLSSGTSTTRFYVSNNQLHLDQNGADIGPLVMQGITTSRFVVSLIATSTRQAVKVEMTLQAVVDGVTKSKNFYGTSIVRGEY